MWPQSEIGKKIVVSASWLDTDCSSNTLSICKTSVRKNIGEFGCGVNMWDKMKHLYTVISYEWFKMLDA